MERVPDGVSRRRRRVRRREDFPLPVRPQIPTFFPGAMVRERLWRIVSFSRLCGRYFGFFSFSYLQRNGGGGGLLVSSSDAIQVDRTG